jgi:hypothetical protein
MSNYADWSSNFSNKYTPYLESDNEEPEVTNVLSKECSPGCNCSKHTESFSSMSMSCSNNCKTNCSCNKTIKRSQLNPTINELDAMYTNIMPPLQLETFENSDRKQYSKKDNKESFKNMGPKLVELAPSITEPIMVLPTQKKEIKETFDNSNLASMSPSSMMMGFTRPMETNESKVIVNSKENFSNSMMDMGIQIQKQEPSNMNMNINMDMSYSNNTPSMMSASMMTPPPQNKKNRK